MNYKIVEGEYYEKDRIVVEVTGVMDGEEKTVLVNLDNTRKTIEFLKFQRAEIDKQIAFNEAREAKIIEITEPVAVVAAEDLAVTP